MKIQLEGKMYLMSNERQFMISEESEREVKDKLTGKMKTEVFMMHETFHQTIEGALTSYLERKLRKSSITTFQGIINKQKEHKLLLKKWFKLSGLDLRQFNE